MDIPAAESRLPCSKELTGIFWLRLEGEFLWVSCVSVLFESQVEECSEKERLGETRVFS